MIGEGPSRNTYKGYTDKARVGRFEDGRQRVEQGGMVEWSGDNCTWATIKNEERKGRNSDEFYSLFADSAPCNNMNAF